MDAGQKVQVWVLCRSAPVKVLILRTTAERGAFWQPVTGGLQAGEAPLAGAAREVLEETGLSLRDSLIAVENGVFQFEARWGGKVTEHPFFAWIDSFEPPAVVMDPKEHQAFEWVTLREALERVEYESNRRVLKNIVQAFSKSAEKNI